jgi:Protein of unknown function (DUF2971)
LKNRYVWAASLGTLNDPFEALVDLKEFPLRDFIAAEMSFLRRGGVCSFAQSPLDPRCWAYYAASYSGYCVEYDTEKLLVGASSEGNLLLPVEYVDKPPVVDLWLYLRTILLSDRSEARYRVAQAALGMKELGWRHESEWRLITGWPGRVEHAPEAVTGLYLGYKMDERALKRFSRWFEGQGIPTFKVTPSSQSYELHATRL